MPAAMRIDELDNQTVPVGYGRLVLDAAASHGVDPTDVLAAAGVPPGVLDEPNERMSVLDAGEILDRAIELTDEPGLGYEIALGSGLLSQGIIGIGMMTCASLREAIDLGVEFLHLRVPVLSAGLRVDGDVAAVAVVEIAPLGVLRRPLYDLFLVKLARIGQLLTDNHLRLDDVEIWFDDPEPPYHERWADRLPPMSFGRGTNELRFPAALLDRRPDTADPAHARLVEEQCRREVEALAGASDVVARVRAALRDDGGRYRSLTEVADALHTSSRTLKRRLHAEGTGFHQVLDEARGSEARRLLSTTALSVEHIAERLGYADARSFRRAFHAWTGSTPSAFRDRHGQG